MEIIQIAAIGKNRELGIGSELVWRLSADLKRFKELTTGYPIIMGRKTFESIGKVLPKRINIVVTRDTTYHVENGVVVHSVEQALETAKNTGAEKIFIIGGGEMYAQALPYTTHLEITHINAEEPRADIFFPTFEQEFEKINETESQEDSGTQFKWATYKRK